ncbi:MAG TPA: hypothetical protein PLU16_15330 [Gallionellaceae bacterium]|jgi:hypothetical protein|nr:hypothetical protein [Gallionellaceae bacterium]HQS76575.1 hypothetical protein [Gallionellaceae bacterium]
MINELRMRRRFAASQIVIGIVATLLYAKLIFEISITASWGTFGYWIILPNVFFFLISAMAISRDQERFKVSLSGLWGSSIAAYSAFALPVLLLGIYRATYSGGGAAIGLALLGLAAPALVPFFLYIGLMIGESLAQKTSNPAFKRDSPRSGRAP